MEYPPKFFSPMIGWVDLAISLAHSTFPSLSILAMTPSDIVWLFPAGV